MYEYNCFFIIFGFLFWGNKVTMQEIVWKEEFSVRNAEIDKQHKQLFDILNKLIESKESSVNSKIIADTLTEMVNYAREHFKTEEMFMADYGYPEFEFHKRSHKEFIKNTGLMSLRIMEGDKNIPEEMLNYLKNWLVNHILDEDKKLGAIFAKTDN